MMLSKYFSKNQASFHAYSKHLELFGKIYVIVRMGFATSSQSKGQVATMATPEKDYYSILGIPSTATAE
jgi:hypothetical protein